MRELYGAVEKVEEEERERVGKPGIAAADVEGQGDREHDAEEE